MTRKDVSKQLYTQITVIVYMFAGMNVRDFIILYIFTGIKTPGFVNWPYYFYTKV